MITFGNDSSNQIYFWCSSWEQSKTCGDIVLYDFGPTNSLQIPSSNWTNDKGSEAMYVLVTPTLQGGWTLLGEVDKFIPVSPYRFLNITSNSTMFMAKLNGQPRETIKLRMISPVKKLLLHSCSCDNFGKVNMVATSDGTFQCI